jgi:hypothetical protein
MLKKSPVVVLFVMAILSVTESTTPLLIIRGV